MKQWIDRVGSYRVEKNPCPHPNLPVNLNSPRSGVLHTTEGGWNSAMSVFKQHYAPHFLVGPGRVAQLVPLGKMATALENPPGGYETNRIAVCQIEVVGFSKEQPYQFPEATLDVLAKLLGVLEGECKIPLNRPFPDAMPPKPWATTQFPRRHAGKWGKVAGWYGHVEVPENSHWDPGYLKWSELMRRADPLPPQPK